jgi:hypothetical protein
MGVKRVFVMVSIVLGVAAVAAAQTEWFDYLNNPVLGPGDPGRWDSGGRFPGAVVFVDGTYHMYFVGWDEPPTDNGMGHATSPDGVVWTLDQANPVLRSGGPGEWDDWLWYPSPAVTHDGAQFHMWYAGTTTGNPVQAGYATSPDGRAWTKYPGNPVMEEGPPGSWDDEHVRPGAVVLDGGTYKMWYSGWNGNIVLIGYAESANGIDWTKHSDPILGYTPGVWDSRVANPSVVFDGIMYHMWYTGYIFSIGDWMIGYAFSTDGMTWRRDPDNPVIGLPGDDIYSLPVIFDGFTWHGWYVPSPGAGPGEFGVDYTTSTCCSGLLFANGFETGDTSLWSSAVP